MWIASGFENTLLRNDISSKDHAVKKKSDQLLNTSELRRQAEVKLGKGRKKVKTQSVAQTENLHLIHELQINQIELEMQNEQLVQSQTEVETGLKHYTELYNDLYDFAPLAYFSISRDGIIRRTNLYGAHLLGRERGELINRRFELFVSGESRPVFTGFLEKVFKDPKKQICDVALLKNGQGTLWAHLEATRSEDGQECRVALMDISARVQAEMALKESNNRFLSLVTSIPGNIAYVNANTLKYEFVNNVFVRSFGIPQEKIVGSHLKEIIGEENYQAALKYIDIARSGRAISYENTFNLVSGKRWVEVNYSPVFDTNGHVVSIAVLSFDITERKQADEALRSATERLELAQSSAGVGVWDWNITDGTIEWTSQMFYLFGLNKDKEPASFDTWRRVLHPEDVLTSEARIAQALEDHVELRNEYRIILPDGQVCWIQASGRGIYNADGQPVRMIGICVDITERKLAEGELHRAKEALEEANLALQTALTREKQLAHTDALTGINNRRYLFELAEYEFNIATRYRQPLSVIFFDIDHFKDVNDSFGHTAGDQMLQRVTQVACAELRAADVIGRYGGEEFVIILPMTNAQQAYPLAERIRVGVAAICMPTEKGDVSVTLSIGIVEMLHDLKTESAENMFRRADKAMYAAKQAGRNRTEIGE